MYAVFHAQALLLESSIVSVSMNQTGLAAARVPGAIASGRGRLGAGLLRHVAERLLGALRARKRTFALASIVAMGLAFVASTSLAKKVWESETTLVYAPLPVPDDGKGLYSPPDLKTLTALINSPENIEKLRKQFKLILPAKAIDKNLTVLIPNGTKVVKLAFRWEEGVQAAAMLNRLTEIFVNGVAEIRRAKLGEHVRDYEINLAKTTERLDAASKAVRDFNRRENLVDYHEDLILINKQIMEFEASILQHRRTESDTLAQVKRMAEHLSEVKDQEAKEVEQEKQYQATTDSVADARRRQDRLRELIGEEQRVQQVVVQLDVKKKEYDRIRKLVTKGAASISEAEAITSEIAVLNAQIRDSEKIRGWKAELEKIDKVVVPDGNKKSSGSPIIQQVLFRRLELELQLTAIREEVRQIEKSLGDKRKTLERLDNLRGVYDSLIRRVEAINVERLQVEAQIAGMKNLMGLTAAEFVIASRAEVGDYPASSNKKFLIIGFGGLGMMFAFGLVVAMELFGTGWSAEERAHQLGLPSLASIAPVGEKARFQQLRGLALRLRQHVPEAGAAIVFSTLSEGGNADEELGELAGFFALRDERVLIIDARVHHPTTAIRALESSKRKPIANVEDTPLDGDQEAEDSNQDKAPGLSDYLAFVCNDPDDICHPEEGYGVDRIPAGQTVVTADALATHRMAELMRELQQRYSILLLIGPSLSHTVDLQILATMANGVVAVVDAPVPVRKEVRRTLDDLRELGSPVLGQIVLSAVV